MLEEKAAVSAWIRCISQGSIRLGRPPRYGALSCETSKESENPAFVFRRSASHLELSGTSVLYPLVSCIRQCTSFMVSIDSAYVISSCLHTYRLIVQYYCTPLCILSLSLLTNIPFCLLSSNTALHRKARLVSSFFILIND